MTSRKKTQNTSEYIVFHNVQSERFLKANTDFEANDGKRENALRAVNVCETKSFGSSERH